MIEFDEKRQQMVDTENGDCMELELRNREESEYSCVICNRQGKGIVVGSLIKPGTAGPRKWILIQAWIPSGRAEPPSNFDVPQVLIDRMVLFLRRIHEARNFAEVLPKFEFVDARKNGGVVK